MDNTTMRHQYTICYENTHFVTQDVVCENIWLTVVIAKFIIDAHHRFTTGKIPTENLSVSPMHCEYVSPPGWEPITKDRFVRPLLKRSPKRDKQRKWWCKVPVWHERDHGLIRSNTGQSETGSFATVPPNALFGLWNNLNHHRKIRNEHT